MFRYVIAAATVFCLMGGNCENGGFQLGVGRWSQLGGDSSGRGFLAARSTFALPPFIQWEARLGGRAFSSPVIGPDGTVYVGTYPGDLVAVAADDNERWRVPFASIFAGSAIISTPAVADDGSIFVITSQLNEEEEPVSTLNKVSPDGDLLWSRFTPAVNSFTTASPKVWDSFVFVFAPLELLVFDFDGNIVAQEHTAFCTPVCGSSGSDLFDFFVEAGKCILTFGVTCLGVEWDPSGPPVSPLETYPFHPSVAVADFASVAPDGLPLVVVVDGFCLSAWRFAPPDLQLLWGEKVYGGGCDDKAVLHTSPAIFADGQVVVGNEKGKVRSFNAVTGDKLWEYDADESVQGVASIGRQIHVTSVFHVHFVDSNGQQVAKFDLPGSTRGAPALSADFAYVSFSGGLHTFSFDLFSSYAVDNTMQGGVSSPAIGEDGTIYVTTGGGKLQAYGTTGSLQRELSFPIVQITSPADGDRLQFLPLSGRTYTVEVADPAGGMFEGRVLISSDREGEICSTEGSGSSFSCDGGQLALGTHVITATAIDTQGAAGVATITVEVIQGELAPPNTAPPVP